MQTNVVRHRPVLIAAVVIAVGAASYAAVRLDRLRMKRPSQPAHKTVKPKLVKLDLDRAVPISLPSPDSGLKAVSFRTSDHREGWVLKIPGDRPIATPAYSKGRLYVGGGYGSHEFYAFDSNTGAVAWQIKTSDDGPSAAVVEDDCVAFNTESCTVIVCDARTGKLLWQEWLGDPLMSQPTIYKGRLYISHPASGRGGANAAPNMQQNGLPSAGAVSTLPPPKQSNDGLSGSPFYLLCADLRTGKHYWQKPIPAEVISAPIVEDGKLFFTCFDGTSFSMDAIAGALIWRKQNAGTSAPLVADGHVIVTEKSKQGSSSFEGLKRLEIKGGAAKDRAALALGKAEYLKADAGGGVAVTKSSQAQLDSSVGFASAPAAAGLGGANKHLGVNTVVGAWAYQGSRASFNDGQIMNAQGRFLNTLSSKNGAMKWRAEAMGKSVADSEQLFSPPSLGAKNLYLCSARGHLLAVSQRDGKLEFAYDTKQPMAFQPALANGNIYAGTANGLIICLKTGEKDADGWTAWGGNAQHNKK